MEELDNEPFQYFPQVRPWVRSWARCIDFSIFQAIGVLWAYLAIQIDPQNKVWILLVTVLFLYSFFFGSWVVIEAACLSFFGTTPGKKFLKVKVSNPNGLSPTFKQALLRGLKLWFYGMGLMIPFVSYGAQAWAYWHLKKSRITKWDDETGLSVSHEPLGILRLTGAIVFVCVWGSLYQVLIRKIVGHH